MQRLRVEILCKFVVYAEEDNASYMTEGTQCCFILFYFIKTDKKQGLRISCIFAIRRNENNRKKFASTFNVTLNVTQDRNI